MLARNIDFDRFAASACSRAASSCAQHGAQRALAPALHHQQHAAAGGQREPEQQRGAQLDVQGASISPSASPTTTHAG